MFAEKKSIVTSIYLVSIAIVLLAITWAPVFAHAKSPVISINESAANSDVTDQELRGNIGVLFGSGGNIIVLNGRDGKLLVDAGIAVSKDKIQAVLNKISTTPIRYVINTHWHWDHTDGNAWMHDQGATIIAQENTLKHLSVTTRVEEWNYTFQPWPATGR